MRRISILILLCMTSLAFGSYKPEICSGKDITRERNVQLKDVVGVWYMHLLVDDTNAVKPDLKYFFKLINGGRAVKEYDFGRSSETRKCVTDVYISRHKFPNRPCFITQQTEPTVMEPFESIAFILDESKSQLFTYSCFGFDKKNKCNVVVATGATRNKTLRPGEKEVFENLMREHGIEIPSAGLPLQRPAANNCGDEFLRRQQLRRRQHRRRKLYRY